MDTANMDTGSTKTMNVEMPEFLKGVRVIGTLSDCVERLRREASCSAQNDGASFDVISHQDPVMLMSKVARQAYQGRDYKKISQLEKISGVELSPLYSNVSEHGEKAWLEAVDAQGKHFFMVCNKSALIWAYPQKTTKTTADGETKFVHVTSIGVYSYNAAIGSAYTIEFRSAAGFVVEAVLDVVMTFIITQIVSKGINFAASALASWMAQRAAAAGAEHYSFMISTKMLKGITAGLSAVIAFAAIILIEWITRLIDKKYYVEAEIYNWDEAYDWKILKHYEDNAITAGNELFTDVTLPKKEIPDVPPFIHDIKILDTAVSYATIVWENDHTFMQGLGVAISMQRVNGQEGFTWALDCPWARDTKQKAVNVVKDDLKAYFKSDNWEKNPLNFEIKEPDGMPVSFLMNAVSGAENNMYRAKISIGGVRMAIVPANKPWNDTGIDLKSGQTATIRYDSGRWSVSPYCKNVDAEGGPFIAKKGYLLPGCREGCLVGKIGNGEAFYVGKELTVSGKSGRLYLGANDDVDGKYGPGYKDNSGELTVLVEIN